MLENLHAYNRIERSIREGELLPDAPDVCHNRTGQIAVVLSSLERKQRRIERHHRQAGAVERFGQQTSPRSEIQHPVGTVTQLTAEYIINEGDTHRSKQHAKPM